MTVGKQHEDMQIKLERGAGHKVRLPERSTNGIWKMHNKDGRWKI